MSSEGSTGPGWEQDNAKFEEQFEQVVKALEASERESPPGGKL